MKHKQVMLTDNPVILLDELRAVKEALKECKDVGETRSALQRYHRSLAVALKEKGISLREARKLMKAKRLPKKVKAGV